MTLDINEAIVNPIVRLNRDLKDAAKTLSGREARYLVDLYYQVQDYRKSAGNQIKAMGKVEEPVALHNWVHENLATLESDIQRALGAYAEANTVGRWALSIVGIGPVIAAGLLAHIDITKSPTVGHIWRFAGLDPTTKWNAGEKRPWNANLKVLCWKIGESFVKVCHNKNDIYGHIYIQRKELEWEANRRGAYAEQCAVGLARLRPGRDQDAKYWYGAYLDAEAVEQYENTPAEERTMGLVKKLAGDIGSGIPMLPPAHVHSRAKRYAVKLFLSHYHHVAFETEYGEKPPKPYILTRPEHTHYLAPPLWPLAD